MNDGVEQYFEIQYSILISRKVRKARLTGFSRTG
jgi:hypothetical protein